MEIEFKYKIKDEEVANSIFLDPEIAEFIDENSRESIELNAIYFDTEDRRLSREGIAFRTRKEGDKYVATLKWNGASEHGLHVREEINVPICELKYFHEPTPDIFSESPMHETLLGVIGDRLLVKMVEMKAIRTQVRVDTGKSISEISYDKGIVINGDKQGVISEMEIELYSGNREDMEEFAEKIAQKYDLEPENRSKFKQGLELNQ